MPVVELVPVAQGIATSMSQVGDVTSATVDTPTLVGGGSVSDAADTSHVEIGAWYDESVNQSHVEILTCDFTTDVPNPIAMGVQVRGSTPAATLASPPDGGRYLWVVWSSLADGTFLGAQHYSFGVFNPLVLCSQSGPATYETFWGNALDRADPSDPGNWCELEPVTVGGGEMSGAWEALTGAGVRISLFIEHFSVGTSDAPTSRIPWLNVHEVRLVIAGTATEVTTQSSPRRAPALRQFQRSRI